MRGRIALSWYIIILILCLGVQKSYAQDFWEKTDGPVGGLVQALVVNEDDVLFAGLRDGGVYKSTDNGSNWAETTLANVSVGYLATGSNGVIVAGMGGEWSWRSLEGIVFYSGDNGDNWTEFDLSENWITALAVNSQGDVFVGISGEGIYRSTDGGENWTNIALGDNWIHAIAITFNGVLFVGSGPDDVYRSTDNGTTWSHVTQTVSWVSAIAFDSYGVVFIGTGSGAIFHSSNSGDSWTELNSTWDYQTVESLKSNLNGDLFVGTEYDGVYRSIDNGVNWTLANQGMPTTSSGICAKALAVNSNGTLFTSIAVGGYAPTTSWQWGAGIYRSLDNGDNWYGITTGLNGSSVNSLAINANGDIFAANPYLDGGQLFCSTDGGNIWTELEIDTLLLSGYYEVNSFAFNSDGVIFISVNTAFPGYGDIYRSVDNGISWSQVIVRQGFTSFRSIIAAQNEILFVATADHGVFKSIDGGNNWTYCGLSNFQINTMIVTGLNELYAITDGNGIYYSVDDGVSWTYAGLADRLVTDIAINNYGHLFVGTITRESWAYADSGSVLRSLDSGNNWEEVSTSFAGVRSLLINPQNRIFVGTDNGVFQSIDNGDHWEGINSGLSNTAVQSLALHPSDIIYAGTRGGGVFQSVGSTTSVAGDKDGFPESIRLIQNYPNPFNPTTIISYSLPEQSFVKLTVFDIQGKAVITLEDEVRLQGNYEVQWNGIDQFGNPTSTGVYFCRLQAGDYNKTIKMVLLR